MELFGTLAKLASAAGLYAFLLHRGGLRPAAVVSVSLAQGMALLCVVPAPVEFVFVTTITLGTCTYAVLALDRPRLQVGILGLCFITFGAMLAHDSGRLFIVLITPLALWNGPHGVDQGMGEGCSGIEGEPP